MSGVSRRKFEVGLSSALETRPTVVSGQPFLHLGSGTTSEEEIRSQWKCGIGENGDITLHWCYQAMGRPGDLLPPPRAPTNLSLYRISDAASSRPSPINENKIARFPVSGRKIHNSDHMSGIMPVSSMAGIPTIQSKQVDGDFCNKVLLCGTAKFGRRCKIRQTTCQ